MFSLLNVASLREDDYQQNFDEVIYPRMPFMHLGAESEFGVPQMNEIPQDDFHLQPNNINLSNSHSESNKVQ